MKCQNHVLVWMTWLHSAFTRARWCPCGPNRECDRDSKENRTNDVEVGDKRASWKSCWIAFDGRLNIVLYSIHKFHKKHFSSILYWLPKILEWNLIRMFPLYFCFNLRSFISWRNRVLPVYSNFCTYFFLFNYCIFTVYSRYLKSVISKRDGCEYLKQVPSIDGSLELI
jgi:hypothetical protein